MKSLLYSSRKRRGSECESWGCPGSSATPQLGDLGRVTRLVSSLGKWEKNESSLLSGMFWVVHKISEGPRAGPGTRRGSKRRIAGNANSGCSSPGVGGAGWTSRIGASADGWEPWFLSKSGPALPDLGWRWGRKNIDFKPFFFVFNAEC